MSVIKLGSILEAGDRSRTLLESCEAEIDTEKKKKPTFVKREEGHNECTFYNVY